MGESRIGVTGLATMGASLARNIAHHGIEVAVHNRTTARLRRFLDDHGGEGPITGAETLADLVAALARPRAVLIMVKAGAPVDAVLDDLVPLLDPGDLVMDGGNSRFTDTQRRAEACAGHGVRYLGVGISGGEEGALEGPSIMPGGDRDAYAAIGDVLETIAAQVDGTPCCAYVGPGGAGHYVKMVHNGIEYADIQLIAESYDLLRSAAGLDLATIADTFRAWNDGDLESFLIEIAARVLAAVDPDTGSPLVDVILDEAEQKGTGRWTAQDALELGVPLTAITEAVFARGVSSFGEQRRAASAELPGPTPGAADEGHDAVDPSRPDSSAGGPGDLVTDVRRALYASKVVAYAQGFQQMEAASRAYGWDLRLGELATIWRGGCIIRARFLDRIREAYDAHDEVAGLLLVPYFRDAVGEAQDSWRRVVATAAQLGIAAPALSSALAYYDGYRRERTPAAVIQGLRDLFGAHTYRRVDRDGAYHLLWGGDGSEVRTDG